MNFNFEHPNGVMLYLDQQQCTLFDVHRTAAGKVLVAASTLLESKRGDGYDALTKSVLKSFGQRTLLLTRFPEDDPGVFVACAV